jgi:hypothetical protein
MVKVYTSGNYVFIEKDGVLYENLAKETLFTKKATDSTQYAVKMNGGDLVIAYADIKKEDGSSYDSQEAFETWYKANTGSAGSSTGGGGSSNPNGQATMSNSAPVVIASNQTAVPTSNSNIDVALSTRLKPADTLAGVTAVGSITNALPAGTNIIGKVSLDKVTYTQSTGNNSSTQLAASGLFTGAIESVLEYPNIILSVRSDQPITITIDQFSDLAGTIQYPNIVYTRTANQGFNDTILLAGSYYRVKVQNTGASSTTNLFIETWMGILPVTPKLTNLGNQPTSINEVNGTALTLGQTTASASFPVAIASDQYNDTYITGQSVQTATVNNILTTVSGTGATDVSAFRSFAVQVASTGTAGTFIFEGSNDNVNFQAIPVYNQALIVTVPIVTAITATASQIIYVGACSFRYLRLRIATTITGGSIQAFTTLCQVPFSATSQQVSNGTAANLLATVSGTVTASNAAGTAAHSAAVSGNPIYTAGKTLPTTIATVDTTLVAGDAAGLPITTGQQVSIKPYGTAELDYNFSIATAATTVTVQTLIPASGTASIRNYVRSLRVATDALGAAGNLLLLDSALTVSSIAITTGLTTTSAVHDLKIGDAVVFTALASGTGVSTNTVYYVTSVGSTTTFNFSATMGGANVVPSVAYTGTTMYRVLDQVRLQTTALVPTKLDYELPLRGIANTATNILIPTSLTSGNIYLTVNGYRGF